MVHRLRRCLTFSTGVNEVAIARCWGDADGRYTNNFDVGDVEMSTIKKNKNKKTIFFKLKKKKKKKKKWRRQCQPRGWRRMSASCQTNETWGSFELHGQRQPATKERPNAGTGGLVMLFKGQGSISWWMSQKRSLIKITNDFNHWGRLAQQSSLSSIANLQPATSQFSSFRHDMAPWPSNFDIKNHSASLDNPSIDILQHMGHRPSSVSQSVMDVKPNWSMLTGVAFTRDSHKSSSDPQFPCLLITSALNPQHNHQHKHQSNSSSTSSGNWIWTESKSSVTIDLTAHLANVITSTLTQLPITGRYCDPEPT